MENERTIVTSCGKEIYIEKVCTAECKLDDFMMHVTEFEDMLIRMYGAGLMDIVYCIRMSITPCKVDKGDYFKIIKSGLAKVELYFYRDQESKELHDMEIEGRSKVINK